MAFKMKGFPYGKSPMKDVTRGPSIKGNHNYDHQMHDEGKGPDPHDEDVPGPPMKQKDSDLKEYLLSEKGFNQKDADLQMKDGSYDLNDAGFKKWFETSSRSDNQKRPKDVDGDTVPMDMKKKNKKY